MPSIVSTVFVWSLLIIFLGGTTYRIYIANRKTKKSCIR